MRRDKRGFTLIELLVAVALIGILAGLGVPAFNSMLARNKAETDLKNLQGAFNIARLEAINRSSQMAVVATNGWGGVIEIREGSGADAAKVFRTIPGVAAGGVVAPSGSNDKVTTVIFDSLGGLDTPSGSIQFNYSQGGYTGTISVCAAGRVVLGSCQ